MESALFSIYVGSHIEGEPAVLNKVCYLSLAGITCTCVFLYVYTNRKSKVGNVSNVPQGVDLHLSCFRAVDMAKSM